MTNGGKGAYRRFRKNVVEKEWDVLVRNVYGEESCVRVSGETESVAMGNVSGEYEIVSVSEVKD
jgi:hypothetical protein